MTARQNVWPFLPGIIDAKRDPRNRMRRLRASRWGSRPPGPTRVIPLRTQSDEPLGGPVPVQPMDQAGRSDNTAPTIRPTMTDLIDGLECVSIAAAARIKRGSWRAIRVQIQRGTLPHVQVADRLYVPLAALKGGDAAEPRGGEEELGRALVPRLSPHGGRAVAGRTTKAHERRLQ